MMKDINAENFLSKRTKEKLKQILAWLYVFEVKSDKKLLDFRN